MFSNVIHYLTKFIIDFPIHLTTPTLAYIDLASFLLSFV